MFVLMAVGLLILGGAVVGIAKHFSVDANPIPSDMRPNLTFSPFVIPANSKTYATANYKFSTVENATQLLSFNALLPGGASVAVSEYTQPPQFAEISEYKDRFLTNVAQQYANVQTANGTIYLGRLTKQNNNQLGVMIEKGLLVFLNPDKELQEAQWRSLGDQLELQKIKD